MVRAYGKEACQGFGKGIAEEEEEEEGFFVCLF